MADLQVSKNENESRYEVHGGGQLMGFLDYEVSNGVVDLPHTKVFPEFEGQGVASTLVKESLDMIRDEGDLRVTPTCPYVEVWIKRHKEYQDLLAE